MGIDYVEPTADSLNLHLENNASLDTLLANRSALGTADSRRFFVPA
ncbi:hypothetical protein [Streptomyces misionensis]